MFVLQCYQWVTSLRLPQRSRRHALHRRMARRRWFAGLLVHPFIIQEPVAQVEANGCFSTVQLFIWPDYNVCVTTGQADSSVVDSVMKMWSPPAGPKDQEPEKDYACMRSSQIPSGSNSCEANQPPRSSRLTDQPNSERVHPGQPNAAAPATPDTPRLPGYTSKTLLSYSAVATCDLKEVTCSNKHVNFGWLLQVFLAW